jgi:hypothetical protein
MDLVLLNPPEKELLAASWCERCLRPGIQASSLCGRTQASVRRSFLEEPVLVCWGRESQRRRSRL